MLELLAAEGKRDGKDYTSDLIHSQVLPSYEDESLPGVRFYRKIMANYTGLPATTEKGYTPRRFSYVSFEGFLNGVMLGEMVKRMADDPKPERIPEIMSSFRDFDLGIDVSVTFDPVSHQGLDAVYFTTVKDGRSQPLNDWERWRK